ncbi:MAG: hypothetical protein WBW81_05910 [Methylocella sp.]
MRYRLTLAVVAAFVGGASIAAHAQAPLVVNRGGGEASIGTGAGTAGHGAGTGARGAGHGAGSGGLQDAGEGTSTGGIAGSGRGSSAGTGGIGNQSNFGGNTGGIKE